ncbi:MAG: DHHA1 domain-containing protein [Candidatus Methanomethylicaceae archaeon]
MKINIDWILAHGDSDGICSAAIALSAFKDAKLFFSHPVGLATDLRQVDGNLLVVDIALPSKDPQEVIGELRRISDAGHEIIYIDHHPYPPNFSSEGFPGELIHSLNASASELTYMRLKNRLDPHMSRVAIYGAIGDYLDRTYNVERLLELWDKRLLYLESGLLVQAIESMGRNHDAKRELARYLSENNLPSADEKIVKRAISETIVEEDMRKVIEAEAKVVGNIAYVIDLKWSLGKSAIYARAAKNVMVGVGAESRKDFVDMSLRTPVEGLELNKSVIEVAGRMGGSGGGHAKAAGARVPRERFKDFLEELNSAIVSKTRNKTVEY